MDSLIAFVFVVFALAIAGGVIVHVRLWRAPATDRSFEVPAGWPWGAAMFDVWRRSVVPLLLGGVAVGAAAVAPGAWLWVVVVTMFGVVMPLLFSIALFNRPKWLVPPAARQQLGLVTLARRRWNG
jgi:hypothetical protein